MYCRTQLVELQRNLEDFEAAGVWVAAVSYDPPGALAQFCDEHGITYPFLSDEGSRLIQQLGILNTLIAPEETVYGIPYPGSYLLDEAGVVVAKFFHREYQLREAPAFMLAEGFGLRPNLEGYPTARTSVDGAVLEATLGARDLKSWQRVNLHLRVRPLEGWTLDGEPTAHVTSTALVRIGAPRKGRLEGGTPGAWEARVELLSELREGAPEAFDVAVDCVLRDSAGARAERTLALRLEVPVGEMNRATS